MAKRTAKRKTRKGFDAGEERKVAPRAFKLNLSDRDVQKAVALGADQLIKRTDSGAVETLRGYIQLCINGKMHATSDDMARCMKGEYAAYDEWRRKNKLPAEKRGDVSKSLISQRVSVLKLYPLPFIMSTLDHCAALRASASRMVDISYMLRDRYMKGNESEQKEAQKTPPTRDEIAAVWSQRGGDREDNSELNAKYPAVARMMEFKAKDGTKSGVLPDLRAIKRVAAQYAKGSKAAAELDAIIDKLDDWSETYLAQLNDACAKAKAAAKKRAAGK